MSVGILPGMVSYASPPAAVAGDQTGMANSAAGIATAGVNVSGNRQLGISIGANGTVAGTILVFAALYVAVMLCFHQLDRLG